MYVTISHKSGQSSLLRRGERTICGILIVEGRGTLASIVFGTETTGVTWSVVDAVTFEDVAIDCLAVEE